MFLRQISIRLFSSVNKTRNRFKLETDLMNSVLSNPAEKVEWQSIRAEMRSSKRVNESNLDGIILGMCNQQRRLDVAKSYFEYLKSQSIQINDVSISQLLRMFYNHYEQDKREVSAKDEAEIIRLSRSLLQKHEILEITLAENIIHGLSLTSEWLECLKLLTQIKELYSPNKSTYSCIISKAIEEDRLDIVWKLLNEMFAKGIAPSTSVLLQYFQKYRDDHAKTEQMLVAFSENNLMLPEESIAQFMEVFRKCQKVQIGKNGNCRSCFNILPSAELNSIEFNHLSDTFLNKALLRNDVFLQSNPEELQSFKNFVEKTAPYDCVIDGLNVAYSHGTGLSPATMAHNVSLSWIIIY